MKITSSVATTISILAMFGVTFGCASLVSKQNDTVYATIAENDERLEAEKAALQTLSYTPNLLKSFEYNGNSFWRFDDSIATATSEKTSEYKGIQIAVASEKYSKNRKLKNYSTEWLSSTTDMLDLFYETNTPEFDLKQYMNNTDGVYTTCVRYNTEWEDYEIPIFDIIQLRPVDDENFVSIHITNGGSTSYSPSEMLGVLSEVFEAYNIPWDASDILSLEMGKGNNTLLSDAQLQSGEFTDTKYFEFDTETGTLVEYRANDANAPTDVVIPPTISGIPVKYIADKAFNKYSSGNKLTSVVIPDSVEKIGDHAFSANSDLKYVIMPANLKELGEGVFSGCFSLRDIEIKGTIYNIPKNTFKSCESIETITLPDTVTTFDDYAFSGCRLLKYLSKPASFKAYGTGTFDGCDRLDTTIFDVKE